MDDVSDVNSGNVEERITGEFMTRLQESEVDFAVVDALEGVIGEEDFGGDDVIIDLVEEELIEDES